MTFNEWFAVAFPSGCDAVMRNALEGAYGAGYQAGWEDEPSHWKPWSDADA